MADNPGDKVFKIRNVVENIYEILNIHNPMKHLELRLISNAFNLTVLHNIRKTHAKIKIEFIEKVVAIHERKGKVVDNIFINFEVANVLHADKYFSFLKQVAHLKVRDIIGKNLWKIDAFFRPILHDSILCTLIGADRHLVRTLIGMEDICRDGCLKCLEVSEKCKAYGPIQMNMLDLNFKWPRHFKTLIVTDRLLEELADLLTASAASLPECLALLDQKFKSPVYCDHLILRITEQRRRGFPREILDKMLEKWNVKSIGLDFIWRSAAGVFHRNQEYQYFTSIKFDYQPDVVAKKGTKEFSHVEVNLSDSESCGGWLAAVYNELLYIDLIPIIRSLFPTNKIMITGSHRYRYGSISLNLSLDRILSTVYKVNQRELEVHIRSFPFGVNHFRIRGTSQLVQFPPVIPFEPHSLFFSVQNDPLPDCYRWMLPTEKSAPNKFTKEKWIGRRCKITDGKSRSCVITWDVYLSPSRYIAWNYVFIDDQMRKLSPNAFLNHFLPISQ